LNILIIKKAANIMTSPMIAQVNPARAFAIFSLSPAAVIHLMPDIIMKITVIIMPAVRRMLRALLRICGPISPLGILLGASSCSPPTLRDK